MIVCDAYNQHFFFITQLVKFILFLYSIDNFKIKINL